ncbi:MAG: hypothetical protein JWO13_2739 [Acidobacteriales bacterium]|nr:hypothetical protein [Terriglobales bacterium]
MPCVFCGTKDNLTDEHVFPAFVGSKLELKQGSCKPHNEHCSRFEGEVANATITARHIFGIPNRDGQIPSAKVTVEIEGMNVDAKLRPDGTVELHDFVQQVKTSDGGKVRHGFFTTNEAAERFVQAGKKRGERMTEVGLPRDLTFQPVSEQRPLFAFTQAARRTAAKIAFVTLAYEYGIDFARHVQFEQLRKYLLGQDEPCPIRIFSNTDFAASQLRTPIQHSVNIHLNTGMHKGWALVTLFGGISYVVELTASYSEAESRSFSLYYDVAEGKVQPITLYSEYELIGRVLSPATSFEDHRKLDEQWFAIIEKYCRERGLDVFRISEQEGD